MNHAPSHPESRFGWLTSLAFWLCLFAAAGLYAAVALAPKYHGYLEIQHEHHRNQWELVRLERRVEYLEQVAHALEHDPNFSAELARIDFDAARPGDERIAVGPALSLDGRDQPWADIGSAPAQPWHTPLVERMAEDRGLRKGCLAASAVIVLLAFTVLQEPRPAGSEPATGPRPLDRLLARYRKPK